MDLKALRSTKALARAERLTHTLRPQEGSYGDHTLD
jgi:hypothetical protein